MAIKQSLFRKTVFILATTALVGCADDSSSSRGSCQVPPSTSAEELLLHSQRNGSPYTQLLVKISNESDITDIRQELMRVHSAYAEQLGKIRIQQVNENVLSIDIPSQSPASRALDQFMAQGQIEYVEPDYINTYIPTTEDDFISEEVLDIIQTQEVPYFSQAGKEVIVAVIDSGVDYTHKDLAPYIWKNPREIPNNGIDDDRNGFVDDVRGWDFAYNDNNPMADDKGSYHGTHVAGIIKSAALLKSSGINLKIMPVKYLDRNGIGYSSNAIRAIDYAIKNGAVILNNSWGSANRSQALSEAIERSRKAHTLFIAAAGNGDSKGNGINIDSRPFYPAAYPHDNIISVAASNSSNQLTKWSNYGKRNVDLAAPGASIRSTLNGNTYGVKSGTSMAAPYVSGVAAAIWALRPELSYREVSSIILNTVKKGTTFNNKLATAGAIDREKALSQAALFDHDPLDERISDITPSGCSL